MKSKRPSYRIDDFFGNTKDYYFYGVQSSLSLFSLALKIQKQLGCEFSYLGDFKPDVNNYDVSFKMVYAPFPSLNNLNLVIVENKTSLFNQPSYYQLKNEKKLNFHTLSLFEEFLYIFNSQGLKIHNWDNFDDDYLFLIYSDKDLIISPFLNDLLVHTNLKHKDASFLLQNGGKKKNDVLRFIEDLYCLAEIMIIEKEKNSKARLLSVNKEICQKNLSYKFYTGIEQFLNSEYFDFLKEDPSFTDQLFKR